MISLLKALKTELLKLSASILGFCSSSSLKCGPPKGFYDSAEEYIRKNKSMGIIKCLLNYPLKNLVCLQGGRICLNPWAFISADDKLLFQESNCYNTRPLDHWIFSSLKLPKATHLKGRTLFLSFRRNYWHSLTDDFSLINLLEANRIELSQFDYIISEKPDNDTMCQLHEIWGIAQDKLISLVELKHIECEEIYFLSGSLSLAKEPILQAREKILNRTKCFKQEPTNKVFISREDANTRRCLNQSECFDLLSSRLNFECIIPSGKNLFEQAEFFNRAEMVVGVHGAGLSNILFMKKDSTVIELRYKKQRGKFSSASCYEELCKLLEIKHHTIFCDGEERHELKGRLIEDADILVDKEELLRVVESYI